MGSCCWGRLVSSAKAFTASQLFCTPGSLTLSCCSNYHTAQMYRSIHSMCTFIRMYACAYLYVYMHVRTYMDMCMCMCMFICMCMYVYIYTDVYKVTHQACDDINTPQDIDTCESKHTSVVCYGPRPKHMQIPAQENMIFVIAFNRCTFLAGCAPE